MYLYFSHYTHRDIVNKEPTVLWKHIKGLETIQATLNESVVTPLEYPNLFAGIVEPWKSVLLHGPPGMKMHNLYIIISKTYNLNNRRNLKNVIDQRKFLSV